MFLDAFGAHCLTHCVCDLRFMLTRFVMSCDVCVRQGGSAIEGAGDERRAAGEFPLGIRGTAFDMFQDGSFSGSCN